MKVPVILGGEECGELAIRREGAYTRFSARCALRQELVRLWVWGGGRRAYLGVMQPEAEALVLRRSLSRAAMLPFPETIEYASDGEERDAAPPEGFSAAFQEKAEGSLSGEKPAAHEEGFLRTEKLAALLKPAADAEWRRRPDGSLVGADERGALLALPCALRRVRPGLDLRQIEGRSYLVFHT